MVLKKIISGGQTGADQGALDAAVDLLFPYGGSIPAGRKTEAGPLAETYDMTVLSSGYYPDRTIKNVKDADGTLIISHGPLTGGSRLTYTVAVERGKAVFHSDLIDRIPEEAVAEVFSWMNRQRIEVLNVAGPRASSDPEIYDCSRRLITGLIEKTVNSYV